MQELHVLSGDLHTPAKFLTSLAIGLLLGLQRERTQTARAGLRTFALVALFGTVTGLLAEVARNDWICAAGLVIVGLMIISAYHGEEKSESDSGTTTIIAVLLCYGLGVMVWYERGQLAVTVGIVATVLLHFKTELHGLTQRFSQQDIASFLQFAVLTFVVLPLLPNEGFGPFRVLNPYQIWLMVVLISGVSLAGYLALRLIGGRKTLLLVGVFGGLVSSTATTLVYARQGKQVPGLMPVAAAIIPISNLVVMVRLSIIGTVVAPATVQVLLPVLGIGLAFGLIALAGRWRGRTVAPDFEIPELDNPTNVRVALGFGLLYALILVGSAWISARAGSQGLYAIAFMSGVADVDAITLSSLNLFNRGQVTAEVAVTAMGVAFMAATAFKLTVIAFIGGRDLLKRCALAVIAPTLGLAVGLRLFA